MNVDHSLPHIHIYLIEEQAIESASVPLELNQKKASTSELTNVWVVKLKQENTPMFKKATKRKPFLGFPHSSIFKLHNNFS